MNIILLNMNIPTSSPRHNIMHLRRLVNARIQTYQSLPPRVKNDVATKIHYDQLEELYDAIHREKEKIKAVEADILETYCESNPSDFECRIYDV